MQPIFDAIIVGSGLAGLTCAQHLAKQGFEFLILEGESTIGGRVRSDYIDGYTLDHGFQVLLTAYPEAASTLDYKSLDLKPFLPGALINDGKYFIRLSDPFKDPSALLSMMVSNIASLADKLRVAYLRQKVMASTVEEIFSQPDKSILRALKDQGFSDNMINRFFRPFFGGITLDNTLSGSSRMFEFVYKMMAEGQVMIPSGGMGKITEQLAAALPQDSIKLNSRVASIDESKGQVTLASGDTLFARAIVIATDSANANSLNGKIEKPPARMATCLYFSADQAPIKEPVLVLNGADNLNNGPINNLAVLSNVAKAYSPAGKHLISVTVLGQHNPEAEEQLIKDVMSQAKAWFGDQTSSWQHLKSYYIAHALPDQSPPWLEKSRPTRLNDNLYVCGDFRENASINGSMISGRKAAEALVADLKVATCK
ncbi:NAD(P)/FAD-dependent oxidoreductase [soil metagenome]